MAWLGSLLATGDAAPTAAGGQPGVAAERET